VRGTGDATISLRSIHHYTRAVKGFSRWLWRDGRAREDKLAHLTSPNPDPDRRHERRALSPEEQARLILAAETGPEAFDLSGPDRAALYRVALGTGFRAGELRSLTLESFDLTSNPPTVTVKAAYSKRRRDDVQPIPPTLAASLESWLAIKRPRAPIFGNLTRRTAEMIQVDLAAAEVPYEDASGRKADFHALRHSYVTALARSGAPVKVLQSLARHSTPVLTLGTYAHVGLYDQTAALDTLPDLTARPTGPEVGAMAATGTDGQRIGKDFGPHLVHEGRGLGRNDSAGFGRDDLKASLSEGPTMGTKSLSDTVLVGSMRLHAGKKRRRGWDSNPR
ncbi:MAG TPA: tyrosine-type recombinase/integrase, partial [Isosphaeraceae bacterium]|nr:tyrosine-type recombinase/integrase [Isosphaeraceae bacterium]